MAYRNSTQIIAELLSATRDSGADGINPTQLLTKTNITHSRLSTLTTNLTSAGLITRFVTEGHKTYAITPRGREYLEMYKKFHSMAESFGLGL